MRKPLIAGNWKMYKVKEEATSFITTLKEQTLDSSVEVLLFAPFMDLRSLCTRTQDTSIHIGAENMFYEKEGAFTGEISPLMLKEAGVTHVLVGHSERRTIFGETNEMLNKKMHAALQNGLYPVYCIGETLEERESGKLETVLKAELTEGLKGISEGDAARIVVAYEPIWAIGTGKTASPEDADKAHALVRSIIKEIFGENIAKEMRILYGGSVKPANVKELMAKENIDGALVGGASLDPLSFTKLINFQKD